MACLSPSCCPCPCPASCLRSYGGVVVRPTVAAQADWYIMDIQQMIDVLKAAPPANAH